jgi:peptidoglycan/LPS O-acetylase OafA/YrhL
MPNRGQLAVGIVLIVLGALFILQKQIPALAPWVEMYSQWPLNIIVAGALLLIIGVLLGIPSMAIPAAVVASVGGIFYYQKVTGDSSSWSYMWTLIIAAVGLGTALSGLLSRNMQQTRSGLGSVAVGGVLFVIFGSLFGKLDVLGGYAPAILLVLAGVWILARGFLSGRKAA